MFATDGIYPKSHLLDAGDAKMYCGIEVPVSTTGYFMVDMHELTKEDEQLLIHLGIEGASICKRCTAKALAHLTMRAADVGQAG